MTTAQHVLAGLYRAGAELASAARILHQAGMIDTASAVAAESRRAIMLARQAEPEITEETP